MTRVGRVASSFWTAYAAHRAAEGRAHTGVALLELPRLASGPPALVRQWEVRARTFEAFARSVLGPAMRRAGRRATLLDLGAGNGWLSHRAARAGCRSIALDVRVDAVDGLGAATGFRDTDGPVHGVAASFDELPIADGSADVVVFNASLHYATDLTAVLREARRVARPGGTIAVLDTPFYQRESDGEAMVAEKRVHAARSFGAQAGALMAPRFIEFLTPARLAAASAPLQLAWRRHRVRYPLWYELRPLRARLLRRRLPSRFDLWECQVP